MIEADPEVLADIKAKSPKVYKEFVDIALATNTFLTRVKADPAYKDQIKDNSIDYAQLSKADQQTINDLLKHAWHSNRRLKDDYMKKVPDADETKVDIALIAEAGRLTKGSIMVHNLPRPAALTAPGKTAASTQTAADSALMAAAQLYRDMPAGPSDYQPPIMPSKPVKRGLS